MTLLAANYIDASRHAGDARAAIALARMAAQAAPGDPRTHAELLKLALLREFDLVRAIHELWETARTATADPWFLAVFALSVPPVLALGALASSLAVLLCLLPRFGPCLYHDFSDAFPRSLRHYAPIAFLFLVTAVALGVGVGLLTMVLGLSLVLLPYPRSQGRWALAVCLATACGAWAGFDHLSRLGGEPGQRAWAYYRAQKGDWGAKLEAELSRRFDPRDVDGLLARAAVARRGGRYEQASELLVAAVRAGADESSTRIELGNLFFLRGQLREAEAEYGRAAASNPRNAVPWINLHVLYLKRLQLADADRAIEYARVLDAGAVERFQRESAGGRGGLLPVTIPLGGERVFTDLLFGEGGETGWPRALSAGLFSGFDWFRPVYLSLLCVVVASLAGGTGAGRHSHRCPSCGAVVCPRCGRRIKGVETCAACWALANQKGADFAERERQRALVVRWKGVARRYGRVVRWMSPGWSDFVLLGSTRGLFVGVAWGLAAGAVALDALYPTPLFAWGGSATWVPWTVLVICHVHGARRAGATLRTHAGE